MRHSCWSTVRLGTVLAPVLVALGCRDPDPATLVGPARAARLELEAASAPRFVVTLAGAEAGDFERNVRALGGRVERRHADIGVITIRGVRPDDIHVLAGRPDVAAIDPDVRLQWIPPPAQLAHQLMAGDAPGIAPPASDQSGAELFPLQWNLRVIDAPEAWHTTPAGNGRLVCVLDTGVDPDHVELSGRVALDRSTSFVEDEPTIQDFNAHGTFVASLVSSNGIRLASVASDTRLCAVKVLRTDGTGSFDDLIAGILFAAHQGADVINMSIGAYVDLKQPGVRRLAHALQKAIAFADGQGALVVAAAGNGAINLDTDGPSMLVIPAQLDHVLSVGATAPFNQLNFDELASYSNFGAKTGIALVAPGGDLPAGGSIFDEVLGACSHTAVTLPFTCKTNYVLSGTGTSFAAPQVAGAAAVIASGLGGRTRPAIIAACLLHGADAVGSPAIFGAGRLNVTRAAACRDR